MEDERWKRNIIGSGWRSGCLSCMRDWKHASNLEDRCGPDLRKQDTALYEGESGVVYGTLFVGNLRHSLRR